MQRKLELIGIILTAAGLIALAIEDPIVRVLIYGTSSGAAARTAFASGGGSASSFTALRSSSAVGGASELIGTFSAFGAAVIGFILIVTASLTRGKGAPKAGEAKQAVQQS